MTTIWTPGRTGRPRPVPGANQRRLDALTAGNQPGAELPHVIREGGGEEKHLAEGPSFSRAKTEKRTVWARKG